MPQKIDAHKSYGQKLISIFAKLLFSGQNLSLSELSSSFGCSKQTVLRIVEDIQRAYGVKVEESFQGNRKFFRIRRVQGRIPLVNMTETELKGLHMCRAFAEHLLGRDFFEETARGLEKSRGLLQEERGFSTGLFGSFRPGSIDYTPHQEAMGVLIEAMDKSRVCKVTYRSAMAEKARAFHIKPLKIFSHRDTVYLHARRAREPSAPFREPDYDPLLAVHRIEKVEMTERQFTYPTDYDFNRVFNGSFGIIKDEAFEVEAELTGYAAFYAAERVWSPDQRIVKTGEHAVRITFSASSTPEVLGWALSFGEEATLLKPAWLVKEMKNKLKKMNGNYSSPHPD